MRLSSSISSHCHLRNVERLERIRMIHGRGEREREDALSELAKDVKSERELMGPHVVGGLLDEVLELLEKNAV